MPRRQRTGARGAAAAFAVVAAGTGVAHAGVTRCVGRCRRTGRDCRAAAREAATQAEAACAGDGACVGPRRDSTARPQRWKRVERRAVIGYLKTP